MLRYTRCVIVGPRIGWKVNLRLIQEWLGHHSPATTSIYTHLTVKAEQLGTRAIDQLMSDL